MNRKVKLKDGRTIRRYSEAFKQKVLLDITEGRLTKKGASTKYDVNQSTIFSWIKKYGRFDLYNPTIEIKMPKEKNQVKELQKEVKELKEALVQMQLKNLKSECDLEAAMEVFGFTAADLEKKSAASHSTKQSKKGKDS
jgi:transposase